MAALDPLDQLALNEAYSLNITHVDGKTTILALTQRDASVRHQWLFPEVRAGKIGVAWRGRHITPHTSQVTAGQRTGNTFTWAGTLLHLHDPIVRTVMSSLVPGDLLNVVWNAGVDTEPAVTEAGFVCDELLLRVTSAVGPERTYRLESHTDLPHRRTIRIDGHRR